MSPEVQHDVSETVDVGTGVSYSALETEKWKHPEDPARIKHEPHTGNHFSILLVDIGPGPRSLFETTPFRAGKKRGRLWSQTYLLSH